MFSSTDSRITTGFLMFVTAAKSDFGVQHQGLSVLLQSDFGIENLKLLYVQILESRQNDYSYSAVKVITT